MGARATPTHSEADNRSEERSKERSEERLKEPSEEQLKEQSEVLSHFIYFCRIWHSIYVCFMNTYSL